MRGRRTGGRRFPAWIDAATRLGTGGPNPAAGAWAWSDELAAVGALGKELFDEFFARFGFRLAREYGSDGARQSLGERTTVAELEHFCREQVRC